MLSQAETPTSTSPLPDTTITVRNDTPTATTPAASVTPLVSDSSPLNPDVSIPVIATTQTKPSDQPFSPVGAFDGMPSAGIILYNICTEVHTVSTLASVKQMVVLSVR